MMKFGGHTQSSKLLTLGFVAAVGSSPTRSMGEYVTGRVYSFTATQAYIFHCNRSMAPGVHLTFPGQSNLQITRTVSNTIIPSTWIYRVTKTGVTPMVTFTLAQ